jgi:hypothetical protein
MESKSEMLYTPAQVGQRLGLKSGMVRRYHGAYEAVTGEALPRDPNTNGRLVNDQQLAILERARAIVRENPSMSTEDAVRVVLGIATVATAPALPNAELLEALLNEMRSFRQEADERLKALEADSKALLVNAALSGPEREWADSEYVSDLEKRNAYLLGELRRRDEQPQARRPWWKVWG